MVAGGRHPKWATAARAVDLPKARAMPMLEGAEACKAGEENSTVVARQGHTLMRARFMEGEVCRFLVGCWTRGCYAVDRLEGLRKSCPGAPTSKGTKEQLRAMQRGRHPLRKKGDCARLEQARPATVAQLAWPWGPLELQGIGRPRPPG